MNGALGTHLGVGGVHGDGQEVPLLGGGEVALLGHGLEHHPPAALGLLERVGALVGVGAVRVAQQAGEERRLPGVERLDVDPEPGARGRLHAVGAPAEVHGVEVAGEDLLLGDLLLELDGHHRFFDLAGGGLLGGEVLLLHVLLGDGGAALAHTLVAQVGHGGAGDAHGIDAAVLEEVAVLGRHHGVAQDRRDLLVGDQHPVLGAVELRHGVGGVAVHLDVGGADERRLLLLGGHPRVDRELDLAQHVDQPGGTDGDRQRGDVEGPAPAPQDAALLDLPLPGDLEVVDRDRFAGAHERGVPPWADAGCGRRNGATLPTTSGARAVAPRPQRAAARPLTGLSRKVRARWFQEQLGHTSTT